jgi:FMN reductase
MSRRIVVVTAGLGTPSSTRLLSDRLAEASVRALEAAGEAAEVTVVELREVAHALADNLLTGFPSGDLDEAVEAVRRAAGLVAVTPVFSASYSGLFKMFFDVLEPETLAGTPVLLGATAGTPRHSLVLEHAMRPLFSYLHAVVVPTAVFAASEDFGSTGLADRVERAAAELASLVAGRPATTKDQVTDVLGGDLVPFEELLRRA